MGIHGDSLKVQRDWGLQLSGALDLSDMAIDRGVWEAVQQKLKGPARQRTSATNHASGSLLAGLIFDETGDRLTPSHAIKGGRRYRYYISQRLMQDRKKDPSGWRLPALEGSCRAAMEERQAVLFWKQSVRLADCKAKKFCAAFLRGELALLV